MDILSTDHPHMSLEWPRDDSGFRELPPLVTGFGCSLRKVDSSGASWLGFGVQRTPSLPHLQGIDTT